ncbi:hypothetical protein GCM10009118_04780 [Wandonia haliotis]|uniref:Tyr recombinase domain-containing protein n=1 Tax=Wandonia haliotis TaxID=574963 RepID=A0ABP3XXC0_9FLAO
MKKTTEKREIDIDLVQRPRKENLLPNVLSKQEVKAILEAHSNIKHRMILTLIYACGLRRSEFIQLKPAAIDSQRKLLKMNQSKGNKDRYIPISDTIIELLRQYYKLFKPKKWLFEGQKSGRSIIKNSINQSQKSLQNIQSPFDDL